MAGRAKAKGRGKRKRTRSKGTARKPGSSPRPHGRRYPWEKWFAHDEFYLVRTRHYDLDSFVMATMLRNVARDRYGMKVSVHVIERGGQLHVTVKERKEGNVR